MSLTIEGKLSQVSHDQRGDNVFYNAVIEGDDSDRFNRPVLHLVRLSKKQVQGGYAPVLEKYIGKRVKLPVWVNAWSGRAGASYTLFLQDCELNNIVVK